MRRILFALAAALTLGWASQALAWGNPGHATVCQIAYLRLTNTARQEVDRLVAAGPWGKSGNARRTAAYPTFGQACTFPDNPHERGDEHFVNYPRSLRAVTAQTQCTRGLLCIFSAIEGELAILASQRTPQAGRAAALFYLGHWIGDLHQPLHVSFGDDFGGGAVNTTGVCGTDGLHSVWDKCIVLRVFRGLHPATGDLPTTTTANQWSNAGAAATELQRTITPAQAAAWLQSGAPWQWAAESYAITLRPDVKYCIDHQGQECWYSATSRVLGTTSRTVNIDDAYVNGFTDEVTLRLQQAGVRLAHVLNRALDPAYAAQHP
ncbi:MAG TPA: S1/P1 nuclease [Allosphingosinicella sp.]|nr:S1/P1 nuclease [Allosphingosinicella sp.]